ncbi:MAG: hypothetical protein GY769_16105 [bacterium]|nr:hypothetical protein [bacterium]
MKDLEKALEVAAAMAKKVPENLQEAAFNRALDELLGKEKVGGGSGGAEERDGGSSAEPSKSDYESFFSSVDSSERPSRCLFRIVAWLYLQHGVFPIQVEDLRCIAEDTGLTIPERPDMTMRQARKGGKSLFRRQGKGYRLTVNGEAFIKETYKVLKGKKPRQSKDNKE